MLCATSAEFWSFDLASKNCVDEFDWLAGMVSLGTRFRYNFDVLLHQFCD